MVYPYDFEDELNQISDEMWKVLISSEPLKNTELLSEKRAILEAISIGINVVRGDGRILGYDFVRNQFYDTHQYLEKRSHGSTDRVSTFIIQLVAGILFFGLINMAGRYILWRNDMPTNTPGVMPMMSIPYQSEYLQKDTSQTDRITAQRIHSDTP